MIECPLCNCTEDKQCFSIPNDIPIYKCKTCRTFFNDNKIVKRGFKQDVIRIMRDLT